MHGLEEDPGETVVDGALVVIVDGAAVVVVVEVVGADVDVVFGGAAVVTGAEFVVDEVVDGTAVVGTGAIVVVVGASVVVDVVVVSFKNTNINVVLDYLI